MEGDSRLREVCVAIVEQAIEGTRALQRVVNKTIFIKDGAGKFDSWLAQRRQSLMYAQYMWYPDLEIDEVIGLIDMNSSGESPEAFAINEHGKVFHYRVDVWLNSQDRGEYDRGARGVASNA